LQKWGYLAYVSFQLKLSFAVVYHKPIPLQKFRMKAGRILVYGLAFLYCIFGSAGRFSAHAKVPFEGFFWHTQLCIIVESFPADTTEPFRVEPTYYGTLLKNWDYFYSGDNLLHPEEFRIMPLEAQKTPLWIFWLLILCLGGLSYARMYFPYRSRQYFKALIGNRNFNQMEREGGYFDEPPAWIFFVNFVLVFSLLVVQTILHTGHSINFGDISKLSLLLITALLVLSFFFFKYLITGFIAWVFQNQAANSAYTRNIYLFNNLVGILILPVVIYYAYNPSLAALYTGWVIVGALNVLKVYRGVAIANNRSAFSPYYLILYLCTVECIPILLIAKLAGLNVL